MFIVLVETVKNKNSGNANRTFKQMEYISLIRFHITDFSTLSSFIKNNNTINLNRFLWFVVKRCKILLTVFFILALFTNKPSTGQKNEFIKNVHLKVNRYGYYSYTISSN